MTLLFNPGCTEDPLPAFHKPNITASAENVSFGNVRLTCTVSNTLFKECGFYYGTRSDLSDKRTVRATVNGQSAEASLSGLEAGTYYFQAYADGGKSVATSGISSFAVKNVLEVDAGDFNLRYGEADIQITVETSLPLVVDLGGATWIKETRTKGLETYHKEFHIARNTGVEPRFAVIRISAQNGELSKSISVRQSGTPVPISDSNFKKYLLENFDTDKDGEIFYEEALKIERIEVSTDNIRSLQGIEFFPNLTYLDCSGSWDSSQGKYLGQLESLDVSKNTALKYLYCQHNQLTGLDVSKNTVLNYLYLSGNQLRIIVFPKSSTLISLECRYNQLTTLDLTENTALIHLGCENNQLKVLDVSKNTALKDLWCDNNRLTALDVSKNTALKQLVCRDNLLAILDVSKNTTLTRLCCGANQLTSLDVSKNTALTHLDCYNNLLTTLDVSKNTALNEMGCHSNRLTILDLSKNTALIDLECGNNQLKILDLPRNTALKHLGCYNNLLTILDVSKNTALTYLNCGGNQFLTDIWLETNQIIPDFNYDTNVATVHRTNGPVWVDLGLPSGLKWATCNVGASSPSDYGNYYAWGETSTKSMYDWTNYKFRVSGDNYDNVTFNKYNTLSSHGTFDNRTRLEMSDDAARANWGGSWRMPTEAEWTELRENCNWTWTTQSGTSGYEVTSRTNGNSIFLPAAGVRLDSSLYDAGSSGYYWSSSLNSYGPDFAWGVYFGSGGVSRNDDVRYYGQSVRPVSE